MALSPSHPIRATHARYHGLLAVVCAVFLLAAPLSASATILQFSLNTLSLSGTSGVLAFDFIDGDGKAGNNTAVISDFSTNGTLDEDDIVIYGDAGDVTGELPGPLTLVDSGFSIYEQRFTFGTTLSFTLTLTQQRGGGIFPDSFAFYLLERYEDPELGEIFIPLFETTDPLGANALFAVDIDGSRGGDVFLFEAVEASVTWTLEPVATVPVPSTVWLLGAGLLGGLMARRRRVPPS
ncbi:MAG: PEP-CTERM sorting domain-containing protein [Candidatus Competibacteraceae bacterium]|nr:MAG: PEP-CTERM sorting domain-containing protein [Candidatus Competibacteraceae bacterium]